MFLSENANDEIWICQRAWKDSYQRGTQEQ